jgi:hypothetical protein
MAQSIRIIAITPFSLFDESAFVQPVILGAGHVRD